MFERYTESARRALFFARYEASELGGIAIETEHLLLGLIRASQGLVSRILAMSQVPVENLRRDVEGRSIFRERIATSVEIPFSAETQRALTFAAEEADRLRHNYIGTEHLFLGLLRDERSVAASILTARGLRMDDVRNTVVKLLAEPPAPSTSSTGADAREVIDEIKSMVEQLAGSPSHSNEAYSLAARIRDRLEDLKRRLAE
jgi:ATP-dependent Clp protease ATP-binding subunit ClpC